LSTKDNLFVLKNLQYATYIAYQQYNNYNQGIQQALKLDLLYQYSGLDGHIYELNDTTGNKLGVSGMVQNGTTLTLSNDSSIFQRFIFDFDW